MKVSSALSGGPRWAVAVIALIIITLPIAASLPDRAAAQPASSDPVMTLEGIPLAVQQRNPFRRLRYFTEQRAYPDTRVPAGALQRARRQYEAAWGARGAQPVPPAFSQNTWTSIGPDHIANAQPYQPAGRLNSIAINPINVNIIYIGAATGGVWKTTDGGVSWTPLTDTQCSLAMGSVAIDPANTNIIYAGTGEQNFSGDSYYGCGVLKSTDGGATWVQLGGSIFDTTTGGAAIAKIAIHPSTTSTLLVASDFGLYRSIDGGANFTLAQSGTATDVVIDPSSPSTMYAATYGGTVHKSTNAGVNWSPLGGGLPTANVGRINLAIAASSPSTVYAAVHNSNTSALLGIFKTTNGGTSWSQLTATGASCSTQCWYDMVIAVDPTNPNTVYFGGVDLYKSTNGGASFTSILNGVHVDQHAWAFLPGNANTVFAGNDGGIYKSTNGGASWTSLNTNLAITQFYAGASLHPTNAAIVMGGTQDNGTMRTTGSLSWDPVIGGDGGYTALDFVTPTTAYGETQWISSSGYSGPRRSDNVGVTNFNLKTSGIILSDAGLFIPPLVMSPSNAQMLYFGLTRFYKTTNRGDTWTAGPDLPGNISAIAQAPSNANVIYAGTSSGSVQKSVDGGTNFAAITPGLPVRFPTDLAVHPTDENTAYVVFSGFGSGHVFRTTNGGTNWTNISGNLPDIPVNAILIDPTAPTTEIFIGTDLGVFRTSNGGASWISFTAGLPNVPVHDLVFNPGTNVLVAATHGRGMWKAIVGSSSPPLVVSPSSNIALSGSQGGPFSPSSFDYQLSATNGSVSYSISGVPSWLTASATSGTVTPSPTTVSFTVNAGANSLSPGTYGPVTIAFTNTTNGQGNTSRTATITVTPVVYTLSVRMSGNGTVTSSPAGINCASNTGTCSNLFTNGTNVTLTASPTSGYTFAGWSGACTNASGTCTVSMTQARSVSATFNQPPAMVGPPAFKLSAFGPGAGGWNSNDTYPRVLADVNGDGMADIVGFGHAGVYVSLATGGGNFAQPTFKLSAFGPGAGGWNSNDTYPRVLADVNGDRMADIVGFGHTGVYVSLATGGGNFAQPVFVLSAFAPGAGGWNSNDTYPRVLADVNGDGTADIVGFGHAGVYVSLATGGGNFAQPTFRLSAFGPGAGGWSSNNTYPRALADVNGGGVADIVGFGHAGAYVSLATGGGNFAQPVFALADYGVGAGGWSSNDAYPRVLADVTGNGTADIVGFGYGGVYVSRSTGGGNFAQSLFALAAFGPGAGGWNSNDTYPRVLADVNGDGIADIVGFGHAGIYVSLATGATPRPQGP